MFSFIVGRRCETGEGIYGFRCRRASLLFRTLQQQIQLRNVIHDSVAYPVSRPIPSPQGRQTLQASVVHRSSVDNGQPLADTLRPVITNLAAMVNNGAVQRHINPSPRSPSSADILEVMPLYPRNQNNSNHATNVYQMREFKRENNNNTQAETSSDPRHVYCNDFNRDLAILRSTLKHETVLNTMRDIEDETRFLESRYVNENNINTHSKSPLSPTLSNSSEHYAQLSLEQQESARLYMNIGPNDKHLELNRNGIPTTAPQTSKQIEYCNLSLGVKQEINTYANLALGELGETLKNAKHNLRFSLQSVNQKFSESDTLASLSPVEDSEVNYAILDIDTNKEVAKIAREIASPENQSSSCSSKTESVISVISQGCGRLVSQSSVDRPPSTNASTPPANIGYTTIDFDKTVALTSVAAGTDVDDACDGSRKTRHNSCNIVCSSPASADKNKTFS